MFMGFMHIGLIILFVTTEFPFLDTFLGTSVYFQERHNICSSWTLNCFFYLFFILLLGLCFQSGMLYFGIRALVKIVFSYNVHKLVINCWSLLRFNHCKWFTVVIIGVPHFKFCVVLQYEEVQSIECSYRKRESFWGIGIKTRVDTHTNIDLDLDTKDGWAD